MLTLEHLVELWERNRVAPGTTVEEFDIGGRRFAFNSSPAMMGVVNLSPDSWYRESVCLSTEAALERGRVLVAQGAELVDLGAESTLAHAARADAAVQIQRLVPVVRELHRQGILVSVETYEFAVARACLEAGAKVINLTGTPLNDDFHRLVADHAAAVILCHVQGEHVRAVGDLDLSGDPVEAMRGSFARQIEGATRCGVKRILLDPGLGFYYRNLQDSALRIRHQMRTFLNTYRLRTLGWPVCHALPHAFECFREEVRSAEAFFAVLAALGKTDLFRTHEVARVRAVLETLRLF
jgi:dihydropteroate synthase